MNGRKLYREYAKFMGKDCAEFVKVTQDHDGVIEFQYKTSDGRIETTYISGFQMINWIIRAFPSNALDNIKRVERSDTWNSI